MDRDSNMVKSLHIISSISKLNEANMYLLQDTCSEHGILIDPTEADVAMKWLAEKNIILDYILLTHEHYDHISALNELRHQTEAQVVASSVCSERIQKPSHNLSRIFDVVLAFKREKFPDQEVYSGKVAPYEAQAADIIFEGQFVLEWRGHQINMWETPGHSKGSMLICIDDAYLFSGDSLSYDFELITRLPGGSKKDYDSITKPLLQSFQEDIQVYPGHGRTFRLKELQEQDTESMGYE